MASLLNRDNSADRFTNGSSTAGSPLPHNGWLVRFGWLIPVSVAIVVYCVAFNNYFTFDDFIWLNRARTLKQDWLQIFRPDVTYFDPLVHFMFWADYQVAGLNYRWYHCVDLVIHATNSLLIYRFARLLSGDERASIYVGILFASSSAIADAVLWSSSRVDLLATLCSLGALIQFLNYLRSEKKRDFLFSFLLFALALGAKGTPLILPLILLWLIVQERKPLRYALHLAPFGAVVILYVILLKLSMHQATLPLDRLHFNIRNIALAFCALFIPEGTLDSIDVMKTATVLFIAVSAIGLLAKTNVKLLRTGYCILTAAITPVLIITDFKLVTKMSDPLMVLASPSHRIYLGSVGAALVGGALLRYGEMFFSNHFPGFARTAAVMILAGVVAGNAYLIRERDSIWEFIGEEHRIAVNGLLPFKGQVEENGQIGLVNFTGSPGFLTPMAKVCLGVDNISQISPVVIGIVDNPEILKKAEKSYLFVLARDNRMYDKSPQFRQLLLLNRMARLNPNSTEYTVEGKAVSSKLKWEIDRLID